jgi:hypothetical protein
LLSLVKQHNDHVSRQDVEAALEVRFRDPDSSKPTAGMAALPVYQETRPGLGLFTATVEDNATTNRVLMRWGLDLPGQAHCIDPALAERDLLALGWRPSGHMSAQGGTMLQFSRPPGGNSAQAPKASRRQPGTVVGIILPPRQTRCMAGFMIDVRQQTGLQQSGFAVPGGFGRDGSFLGRQPGQIFERGGIKGFIKAGTVPRNAELNPNP